MFRVWRGVRQGDPISCLVFDLAIEPLACAFRRSSLRGLRIPGEAERLVAKLFADDTTVFLGKGDEYGTVTDITDRWCRASRARFNAGKTEILPVGSKEHRERFLRTRQLEEGGPVIPASAHIVRDGEAIRLLGAWIGNGIDQAAPWTPILRVIETNLEKWQRGRPTLLGRKLALGIELAGRTQFRAFVQPMPMEVERRLTRIAVDFMWNGDKHPRIAREQLYRPVSEGGLNLLDVAARNDAISLMWLRTYLSLGLKRPLWARVADALLARAVTADTRNAELSARINTFLQTWDVSTRAQAGLPTCLRTMIKAAKKYNVRCVAGNPTESLREQLPIWYHTARVPGRSVDNSKSARCLRDKHQIRTVGQCAMAASRLDRPGSLHSTRRSCACDDCLQDRTLYGCDNPHRCAYAAKVALGKLNETWKLGRAENEDGLTLSEGRKTTNEAARLANERVVFDPTLSTDLPIAESFRVFVEGDWQAARPALRPAQVFQLPHEEVEVHTDGSALHGSAGEARAASGVWFGENDRRNEGVRVPWDRQTNQTAEIYAIVVASRKCPPFAPLHFVSDSRYVVDGLTKYLPQWERRGWIGVANAEAFQEAAGFLRARGAVTSFKWIKGHSGVRGNEEADRLAGEATELPAPYRPLFLPPRECYVVKGASLPHLTQRLAYEGVRKWNRKDARVTTVNALQRIQDDLVSAARACPPPETVWKLLRGEAISRKARDFTWKAIHGGLRVGKYWKHIPTFEDRANCVHCAALESLDHILCECVSPAQQTAWALARGLLAKRGFRLPSVTLGLALGGHALEIYNADGKRDAGTTRLARIIVSETAYLVWVLRCERTIGGRAPLGPAAESDYVERRWMQVVNRRLALDRGLARRKPAKGRAPSAAAISMTWESVLAENGPHNTNWLDNMEVLVGKPLRQYVPAGD